jgi:hypothetical protein
MGWVVERGEPRIEIMSQRTPRSKVIRSGREAGKLAWQENSCPDYNFFQKSF